MTSPPLYFKPFERKGEHAFAFERKQTHAHHPPKRIQNDTKKPAFVKNHNKNGQKNDIHFLCTKITIFDKITTS